MSIDEFTTWVKSKGLSLVTVYTDSNYRRYDINAEGSAHAIGYELGHELVMLANLKACLQEKGVLVVNNVRKDKTYKAVNEKGELVDQPEHDIYMFKGEGDHFFAVPKDLVATANCTDPKTGAATPKPVGVNFCQFSHLNN